MKEHYTLYTDDRSSIYIIYGEGSYDVPLVGAFGATTVPLVQEWCE